MSTELTPEEMAFFETGELPAALEAEHVAQQAQPVEVAPEVLPVASVVEPLLIAPSAADTTELLRQTLAQQQQQFAQAQERLAQLEKQLEAQANPPAIEPDPQTDPLGNMMFKLQQVNNNVADLQQKLTQEQQNNLLKQQFEQFTSSVQQMKATFEQTTPDFKDAYAHIRNVRTEDLRSVGISEADIPKILLQDEINISQAALQRAKNPAEEIYNMAKRYGYVPKAAAPQNVSAQQKVENLRKGLDAAKQPARAAPESDLTLAGLKDAGEDDLNKMVQDDKLWHKIMGKSSGNDIF